MAALTRWATIRSNNQYKHYENVYRIPQCGLLIACSGIVMGMGRVRERKQPYTVGPAPAPDTPPRLGIAVVSANGTYLQRASK